MTITGPDWVYFGTPKTHHDWVIPPGTKKITILPGAATVSGSQTDLLIRLKTSAGILEAGPTFSYHSRAMLHTLGGNLAYPPANPGPGYTNEFRVIVGNPSLGLHGQIDLALLDDAIHAWSAKWVINYSWSATTQTGGGSKQCDTEVTGLHIRASGDGLIGNGRIGVLCET